MNANSIIATEDKTLYFCGWDQLGEIQMRKPDQAGLAYRMSRTVADRNKYKIEEFTGKKCVILRQC